MSLLPTAGGKPGVFLSDTIIYLTFNKALAVRYSLITFLLHDILIKRYTTFMFWQITAAFAATLGLLFAIFVFAYPHLQRRRRRKPLLRIVELRKQVNVLKINTDLWDAFTYHDLDIQLNRLPIVNIKSNVQALRDEGKSIVVISVEAGEDVTNAANTIWKELTTITNVLNALCVIIEFDDDVTTDVTIDSQTVAISKHNAPEIIEEHRNILAVPCNLIIDKSTQAIVLLSK